MVIQLAKHPIIKPRRSNNSCENFLIEEIKIGHCTSCGLSFSACTNTHRAMEAMAHLRERDWHQIIRLLLEIRQKLLGGHGAACKVPSRRHGWHFWTTATSGQQQPPQHRFLFGWCPCAHFHGNINADFMSTTALQTCHNEVAGGWASLTLPPESSGRHKLKTWMLIP